MGVNESLWRPGQIANLIFVIVDKYDPAIVPRSSIVATRLIETFANSDLDNIIQGFGTSRMYG